MKNSIRTALFALLAFATLRAMHAAGNLTTINPVLIPAGLDAKDAKAGMVQSIIKANMPTENSGKPNRWADIVDSLLHSQSWAYGIQASTKASRGWFIESVEKDAVIFGCRMRSHYLSVRMQIAENKITPQVVASENLKQTKDSIHPNAINWITNLSTEIRVTLGRFSAIKAEMQEAEAAASKTAEPQSPSSSPASVSSQS